MFGKPIQNKQKKSHKSVQILISTVNQLIEGEGHVSRGGDDKSKGGVGRGGRTTVALALLRFLEERELERGCETTLLSSRSTGVYAGRVEMVDMLGVERCQALWYVGGRERPALRGGPEPLRSEYGDIEPTPTAESIRGSNCGETGDRMFLKFPKSSEIYHGDVDISGRDRSDSCGGEGNSAREGDRSFQVSKLGVGLGVGRALTGSNLCDAPKVVISGITPGVVST